MLQVTDTYMRAVNTGIASLSPNYKPSVTAVAVSKDHNERIYKTVSLYGGASRDFA